MKRKDASRDKTNIINGYQNIWENAMRLQKRSPSKPRKLP
jgi:hypothetical protein